VAITETELTTSLISAIKILEIPFVFSKAYSGRLYIVNVEIFSSSSRNKSLSPERRT
jgi:hypothetical protein